jgi:hypothetical protein
MMPKPPKPYVPPPPPTVDEALKNRDQNDLLRLRRGRAATFLSQGQPSAPAGGIATKTLLGQGG